MGNRPLFALMPQAAHLPATPAPAAVPPWLGLHSSAEEPWQIQSSTGEKAAGKGGSFVKRIKDQETTGRLWEVPAAAETNSLKLLLPIWRDNVLHYQAV